MAFPSPAITLPDTIAARVFDAEQKLASTTPDHEISNWVFFVDDGAADLALSAESQKKNDVVVGRVDPVVSGALAQIATHVLFTMDDVDDDRFVKPDGGIAEFGGFADHWHIYAHGYHWIAISLTSDKIGVGVYLVQFELPSTGPVIHKGGVIFAPAGPDDYYPAEAGEAYGGRQRILTNDLFLVETSDGVAIGVLANQETTPTGEARFDAGHVIFDVAKSDWTVTRREVVGGSEASPGAADPYPHWMLGPRWSHENGASATSVPFLDAVLPGWPTGPTRWSGDGAATCSSWWAGTGGSTTRQLGTSRSRAGEATRRSTRSARTSRPRSCRCPSDCCAC